MKKSKYKRKRALHGTVAVKATAEKVKESAIQTGKDLLIGVIGGGIAGAVIGKSSLLIGLGVTGFGHYSKKPTLTTFGIGMMAASGFNAGVNGTQGIDGFSANDIKARVMSFKDSISSKLFLDKILKKKESSTSGMEGTDGIGTVQYLSATDELDFSALNRLENQILKSGSEYQKSIQGTVQEPVQEIPETFEGGLEELDFTSTSY
jgi:hypothetical protein